jgi:PTH1 family peptidyl-tRNA hydrolase
LKTKISEILLVHDDSDLPLGTFKFSFGRGAAGHHGVESAIAALRSSDFWRLRIGVRGDAPQGARRKAGEFVLRTMTAAEEKTIYRAFDDAMTKLIVKERP